MLKVPKEASLANSWVYNTIQYKILPFAYKAHHSMAPRTTGRLYYRIINPEVLYDMRDDNSAFNSTNVLLSLSLIFIRDFL